MFLYILYILLSPILFLIVLISSIFNKKIRHRLLNQQKTINNSFNVIKEKKNDRDIIILHAASAGEMEQIKPVLRCINKTKFFTLVTYSSISISKNLPLKLADSFCYLPFDFIWSIFHFLYKIKPKKIIITRHDIWPNFILISKFLKINLLLINANMHKKSKRILPLIKSFNSLIYKNFDLIYTPSEKMKERIGLLTNNNKIIVNTDTRFEQILYRSKYNKKDGLIKKFCNYENIIFGSIDQKDIEIIFNSLKLYTKKMKLIFVPHEPTPKIIKKIEDNLKIYDIKYCLYTELDDKEYDCLIVNTVGILPELYSYSKMAYIGCGFGEGVHSVIEPAIYSNLICFGPNYHILNEAEELIKNKLATVINTAEDLTELYKNSFNSDLVKQNTEKIRLYINNKVENINGIIEEINK